MFIHLFRLDLSVSTLFSGQPFSRDATVKLCSVYQDIVIACTQCWCLLSICKWNGQGSSLCTVL